MQTESSVSVYAHFPIPVGADIETVEGLICDMLAYGITSTDDLWKATENLFGMAFEFGDIVRYQRLSGQPPINPTELGEVYNAEQVSDETHSHAEVEADTTHLDIYGLTKCHFHEFELATPCLLTSCRFQSSLAVMGCGFNVKSPDTLAFEVIAEKLEIDVEEAAQEYHSAISKLRASHFGKSGLIEPHWDHVSIPGVCSICSSHAEDEEHVCASCTNKYSSYGVNLILSYRRDLKDILTEVAKRHDVFKMQAEILNVSQSTLQNLYLIVGIPRRCTVAAANEYAATHPRPGKAISMYGHEYIAAGVFTAQRVFGDFTDSTLSRLSALHKRVRTFGFESQMTFAIDG